MFEIIPSPGTEMKDWREMEERIKLVLPFAKAIHIDIADGLFTPNKTFADSKPFKKYADDVLLEVHLMVNEPIHHLQAWADAGFKRFIGHVEKMSNQTEFVAKAQLLGEVGLAVDGPSPLEAITVPFTDLDCVLFYTSDRAGYSGKPFMPERLAKVKQLRSHNNYIPIEVDGGINDETIKIAAGAGVTRFVATNFIFKANPLDQYRKLLKLLGD